MQALLSTEKSIKCEKIAEDEVEEVEVTDVPSVNTSMVAISVTPQQPLFPPVGQSQVGCRKFVKFVCTINF